MGILGNTIYTLYRKPSILVMTAAAAFAASLLSMFNPVPSLVIGIGTIGNSDFLNSAVSMIHFLWEPEILENTILALGATGIFAAFIASLLLPGYFNMLNLSVLGYPRKKKAFGDGFKKFFSGFLTINLRVVGIFFLYTLFALIVAVPGLILSRTMTVEKPQFFVAALFIDILTVFALYFSFSFLRIYLVFWYPSVINGFRKPFTTGKRIGDSIFWKLFGSFLIFDLFFVSCYLMIGIVESEYISLALKWVFNTLFISIFFSFIFNSFKMGAAAYNGKKPLV